MNPQTFSSDSWQTKPSDRFVLKWIKCHLSAKVTPRLVGMAWLRPWMITVAASCVGMLAGVTYALGWAWQAALVATASQVLDGVDGQYARLTGRQSAAGALLDSVLDRYTDGAMVMGMIIYLAREELPIALWQLLLLGALAVIGSNLVSYSSARADALGIAPGKPTLASKGTRMAVMVLCAGGTLFWPGLPLAALCYLAVHPNGAVVLRLLRAFRDVAQSAPR